MLTEYINIGIQFLIVYATQNLVPFMVLTFIGAAFLRKVIYFTIRCEAAFAQEFEKRVHKYLADPSFDQGSRNFHTLTKRSLERTFDEHYNLKNDDYVGEKIFLNLPTFKKIILSPFFLKLRYIWSGKK